MTVADNFISSCASCHPVSQTPSTSADGKPIPMTQQRGENGPVNDYRKKQWLPVDDAKTMQWYILPCIPLLFRLGGH